MSLPKHRAIEQEAPSRAGRDGGAGVSLIVWARTAKLDEDPDRPAERQVLRGLD